MIKQRFRTLLLVLPITLAMLTANAQMPSKWKMKNIPITTRWDNDICSSNPLPEYPRPQMQRDNNWINLNGLWNYCITKNTDSLPRDFNKVILVPFPIESALSGVKQKLLPNELLWYKKIFNKPILKRNERLLIHFGAVDWQATVYLNGIKVCSHSGGYTAFSCDITDALKTSNELILKVYDPTDKGMGPHGKQLLNPGNIYYTPTSGIWQTVWMECVPANHIESFRITPDIDKSQLNVKVTAPNGFSIIMIARDHNNGVFKTKGKTGEVISLKIKDAHLWSPDNPYLYDLTLRLLKDNIVMDEVKSYFGMRKISIQKDDKGIERIALNNKPYFNLGVLDQGFWPDGLYTAPTDSALKFDIEAIKAMGFNTIRKHIKVEPARWYYYADKLGILLWQDFVNPNQQLPDGAKAEYEKDLLSTLDQLYNSPSLVTWVVFNEKWGQYDQKRLTELVKHNDPSRLVNGHSGEMLYVNNELRSLSPNAWVSSDMTDVHSYPMPRNAPAESGKARVLGEFGGIGVPVEGHLWNDLVAGWGYDGIATPAILQKQYSQMVDSLVVLKNEGLSASIYTQPFDVESEQNGLMTYDRRIAKLPLLTIRNINSRLITPTNNQIININIADTNVLSYNARIELARYGRNDSAFLRNLAIMAYQKKDTLSAMEGSKNYIRQLRDPFAEINLSFIRQLTLSTQDTCFLFTISNKERFDSILGMNAAENSIMRIIDHDMIEPYLNKENVDWTQIEKEVIPKYGELGEERIWAAKIGYYYNKKDWKNLAPYYKLYFDKVISLNRNFLNINNVSWPIFENINDSTVLATAVRSMQYSVENFDRQDPYALDTYANLLYKVGQRDKALLWEKEAVRLSDNNQDIRGNYDKMMKNEKTWK
jgi:hypothetical protein